MGEWWGLAAGVRGGGESRPGAPLLFIRRQEEAEDRLYHLAPAFAGKGFPRKVLSNAGSSGPSVRRAARGCVRARSASPGSLSEPVRACVCGVCECMCVRVCVSV